MTQRQFVNDGPGYWHATDSSGVLISMNGTETMLTVEAPDGHMKDFRVSTDEPAIVALNRAMDYARTL